MHRAQSVADQSLKGVTASAIGSKPLTSAEASALSAALVQDARDAIYSGALTIAEAVQGLHRRQFTWATVKLYYSVFYLARATLALSGTCIFYVNKTPYTWISAAGDAPKKRSGTTHKVVLDAFKTHLPGHVLVSQPIGVDDPYEWLAARREAANYKLARFSEPDAPAHFKIVEKHGVRQPLRDYLADDVHLFTFDPDHAMLSLPVAAIKAVLVLLRQSTGAGLSVDDCAFVARQCFDRAGPVPEFRKLLLG